MTEKDLIIQDLRRENKELKARVQEWISVDDRLPEPFVSVLVNMPGEEPCPTVREGFISNDGIWQSAMFRREPGEVTHWKPMPQPPKGELLGYFRLNVLCVGTKPICNRPTPTAYGK